MILGDLNLGEIWIFFRYRSFPITVNILLLFSWVYLILVYLLNRKNKSYYFLALGTGVLFLKEMILFFTVRHVVFNQGLTQVNIGFTDWIVLETISTFLFVTCLSNAYVKLPFNKKFDYPAPQVFKSRSLWAWINAGVLAVLIVVAFNVGQTETSVAKIVIAFMLILLSVSYLTYVGISSNRIRINYQAFGGGWLNKDSHLMLLIYLGLTLLIYLGFFIMGIFLWMDAASPNYTMSDSVRETPENYFHAFKTVSYTFYVVYILFILSKNYQLANSFKKMQYYISKEVNSIGERIRQQVLRYEEPKAVIKSILKEAAGHTQAEFAFFCFYKKKETILTYMEHVSDSSKYHDTLKKTDLSGFLKNIVDRQRPIILDEIEELNTSFKENFAFLQESETLEGTSSTTDGNAFLCKVKSLLATPIFNHNRLTYTIILINKKQDYYGEWSEETNYSFLEALAEETRFLLDYLVDHETFIEKRNKAFDQRMGITQNSIIELATKSVHEKLEKSDDFSLTWSTAYKDRPLKTVMSMATFQKNKTLVMIADIHGETSVRSYLAGLLQAAFYQSAQHEKKLVGVMERLNDLLVLSQQKNFVSATLYFYDEDRRKFFFGNAAHTPILIFHTASHELISYDIDDPPLSIDTDTKFRDANTDINEGDIIITYSEDLFNLKDEQGEDLFSSAKIGSIIKNMESRDPQLIADHLALECEKANLPIETQPVFSVGHALKKMTSSDK